MRRETDEGGGALAAADLAAAEAALRAASGLCLSPGMRRALPAAIGDAAAAAGLGPAELVRRAAAGDEAAVEALVERSLVAETLFWRHPEQLEALRELAFGREGPLRLWSAGCASGEEPYSLAMALAEAGRAGRGDLILATDLSPRLLARGRAGRYGAWALRRMPEALRRRWLVGEPPEVEVRDELRTPVTFARHNLVADPPPPTAFDVVVCRNVLIYFDPVVAAEVLYKLLGATRPGGLLVLGPVELPLATELDVEWIDVRGASVLRRRPPRG
jgi:chemotaxis protein methyltransferase CheR